MKKVLSLTILLFISSILLAQVSKTVNCTAGALSSLLTTTEKNTVTTLTITGTIDARDFKTMRDSMILLSTIDLRAVNIAAYSGSEGTSDWDDIQDYQSNVIPRYALRYSKELLNIILPQSITKIEGSAFFECENLVEIFIPNSVTFIGGATFSGCKSLREIALPLSLKSIESETFNHCQKLSSISIPDSVTSIGRYAFCYCDSLKTVNIPSTVNIIGSYTFGACKSLTSITIPSSVNSIGQYAFWGCEMLNSVDLPNSIAKLNEYTFLNCKSLTKIELPSSLVTIDQGAFFGCDSLTSILFPSSLDTIGVEAFNSCKNLSNVTLPKGLMKLGSGAFQNCINLKSVLLPDSITQIADYLFRGCEELDSVVIPTLVTSIGGNAFENCQSIRFLSLNSRIKVIHNAAFAFCKNLSTIILPDSLTSIGRYAFGACNGLDSINISSRVNVILEGAFCCDAIVNVDPLNPFFYSSNGVLFNKNQTKIILCTTSKTGIYEIPITVDSISMFAFSDCSRIDTISIPKNVDVIGDFAFQSCSSLKSVFIYSIVPLQVGLVFNAVNTTICDLHVPYGSKTAYQLARQWKDFQHIVEMHGVIVDTTATMGADWGSRDSVVISSNTSWMLSSDSPWLTVTPAEGNGNDTLVFVAKGNPTTATRTAVVTLLGDSIESRTITVIQDAGTGSSVPDDYALNDSTVLSGEMPCFNASDTITVAGDGSLVEFYDDSSVELIAGSTIRFLPGFHAYEGSFAHAWITTDGSFCDGSSGTIVEIPQPEKSGDAGTILPMGDGEDGGMELKVYPNPNKGKFIIELAKVETKAEVKVYSALGELVYRAEVQDGQSTIDLSGTRRGLYVVMVTDGKERESRKVLVE